MERLFTQSGGMRTTIETLPDGSTLFRNYTDRAAEHRLMEKCKAERVAGMNTNDKPRKKLGSVSYARMESWRAELGGVHPMQLPREERDVFFRVKLADPDYSNFRTCERI